MLLFLSGKHKTGHVISIFYSNYKIFELIHLFFFFSGVLCNTWKVEYQQENICAVNGSSVVIPCLFEHPDNQRVKRVLWGHVKSYRIKGRFTSVGNLRNNTKFQYVGDRHRNCSLKIHQVDHDDAGKYTVRFFTNNKQSRWPGNVSPTLKVVGRFNSSFA